MRQAAIAILIVLMSALGCVAVDMDDSSEITHDLSKRDAAAFYDFNADLLTHLGKRIKLDVVIASEDSICKDGWLLSSYHITPNELRGIELRVPKSAITEDEDGLLRVRGQFKLSEVMSHKQGQFSLHLLPVD